MDRKDLKNLTEIHDNWPNSFQTRDELDSALEAGEASGVSDLTFEQIRERTIARMKTNGDL